MLIDCPACDGAGDVRIPDPTGNDVGELATCPACCGTGVHQADLLIEHATERNAS